jgi:hypothetical protein
VTTVGRAADEFEFTLPAMSQDHYGWGEDRRELACESCGAVIAISPDALTSTCPFCGSHHVLAREPAEDVLRPTALIPFVVDRERLQGLVRNWLGSGWMHPPELQRIRGLRDLVGIYLPYWTFSARVRADWNAEVGTEETQRYRDGGEWRTRRVLRWHWRAGHVERTIEDRLVAGTARVSARLLGGIAPFELRDLVDYHQGCLAGWQAKAYDIRLREAWATAKQDIRDLIMRACHEDAGSTHVRNLKTVADFDEERWRYILLPVYLASYPFEGRTFQLMVNGQTGKIAGQKPVAWIRVWLATAALLAPGACLGLLGLLTLALGGIGLIGLALGFVLFAAGLVGAVFLFRRAQLAEEL